jgi:hypothetical protein
MATAADITSFETALLPYAQDAGTQLGVDPTTILGQWGLESGFGTSAAAQGNNFAGLTNAGEGTGYRTYSSLADFEAAFVSNVKRLHPAALNTGSDVNAYAAGLGTGGSGSYFGTQSPGSYAAGVQSAAGVLGSVTTTPQTLVGRVVGGVTGAAGDAASAVWGKVGPIAADVGLMAFGLVLVVVLVAAGAKGATS